MKSRLLWVGLGIALLAAGVLSYYASSSPDGLERVAEDLGFAQYAQDSATAGSPVADYQIAGLPGRWSVGLAGVIGVAATAALAFGLFALLARRNGQRDASASAQ